MIFMSQVVIHLLIEVGLVKEVRDPMKKMMRCFCLRKSSDRSYQDESEESLFCKGSRLRNFVSMLNAALEHNKYGHSEQQDSKSNGSLHKMSSTDGKDTEVDTL